MQNPKEPRLPTNTTHRTVFNHPPGLTILFLTEVWEQFSYYGMRALLVYYMTTQLMIAQSTSSMIYAAYIGAAYFTPIAGGIIADRWLGRHRAVIIGGVIMGIGHLMMMAESLLIPALATIAVGNGLYVPNIPSQIRDLYVPADPRRARAYNVYYVGGNIGGLLAPLVCGFLGETYGWHYGFAAAGIGMFAGVCIYIAGLRYLPAAPSLSSQQRSPEPVLAGEGDRQRLHMLIAVLLLVIVFRGAYEQVGNTVALWIQDADRAIGTLVIPMTWFQSLNAGLVILLTPLILAYWRRRERAGRRITTAHNMAFGAALVSASYVLLSMVDTSASDAATQPHWMWIALFFLLFTAGELFVLPVGLSLFARLAPKKLASTVVAFWFAAISLGNLLAGWLGTLWSRTDPAQFFLIIAAVAAAPALLLLFFNRKFTTAENEVPQEGIRISPVH